MAESMTAVNVATQDQYQFLVHKRLYTKRQHEPDQEQWSQEEIERLVGNVRSKFGKFFVAMECGCEVIPIVNKYNTKEAEHRSFHGFGVLSKAGDPEIDRLIRIHSQMESSERGKQSIRRDPSGVGLLGDAFPDTMRPADLWMEIAKGELPDHTDKDMATAEHFNDITHKEERPKWLSLLQILHTRIEQRKKGICGWFVNKHSVNELQSLLGNAQVMLRLFDNFHATAAEEFSWHRLGFHFHNVHQKKEEEHERESTMAPTIKYLQEGYQDLRRALNTIENASLKL